MTIGTWFSSARCAAARQQRLREQLRLIEAELADVPYELFEDERSDE